MKGESRLIFEHEQYCTKLRVLYTGSGNIAIIGDYVNRNTGRQCWGGTINMTWNIGGIQGWELMTSEFKHRTKSQESQK